MSTSTLDDTAVRTPPRFAVTGVAAIAALGSVALQAFLGRYGFFGDELYFVSAGRRLSFGYADQGPLVPLIAHAMDAVAPGSLFVLRLPAVVATAGAIVVTALITRELGAPARRNFWPRPGTRRRRFFSSRVRSCPPT
ncbi:hypothetical protein [Mycolicibacterium mageritense]|uniref:hypothetical protein n=1 Tax=Mycolicibacterium mageritense TaxID=53462 RepID=UPI001E323E68|nr:hypothetical protein [Mycolicibacterium mageritense]MCC9183204.1 hypothetical protein [Mycolicibacterium mageritense]